MTERLASSVDGDLDLSPSLTALRRGVVVSCQAPPGSPMAAAEVIVAVAGAAEQGGAAGLRIASPEHVSAVRAHTALPIIGLTKRYDPLSRRPFITPTFEDCARLVEAGADIVALETVAESRRPDEIAGLLARVAGELGVPVMADVATFAEGMLAWGAGAALVSTTLSGYTASTVDRRLPDLDLVADLAKAGVRVVLEGGVSRPSEVAEALAAGAWSVVIGTAITDPAALTARFVGGAA